MEGKDKRDDSGFFAKWFQSLRKAVARLHGKEAVELTKESLHIVSHGHGNGDMQLGASSPLAALKQDAGAAGMTVEHVAAQLPPMVSEESAWVNKMAASTVGILEKAR